ncbi:MAG: hypothetical protein LAO51_18520 [Acidobacteriia bacterium]|nr:hypothetical protein [Terriglobia bacterium]
MVAMALCLVLAGPSLAGTNPPAAGADMTIEYRGSAPEGLVGNGRSVVKVRPDGFEFFSGGTATGRFRLVIDGVAREIASRDISATFFPGGVEYRAVVGGLVVRVLHGATAETPYATVIRVERATGPVAMEVESRGEPAILPSGRIPVTLVDGEGTVIVAAGPGAAPTSYEDARRRFEEPYVGGLQLETPAHAIDRAVRFNRFLLDLGFDGRLHVCEIFRWRDVWSRDLGSGLAPGAMIGGRFAAARTTIEYDLRRYAAANPKGLKVTEDPSQGGSAEGTAWLTRAVWRYYVLTGDKAFLAAAERTLRPWVEAWIDRDPAETGLLVDVTEWMDHSRFFLFPDGARVLYSNVLFAELLGTFSTIERTLGDPAAARRLEGVQARFVRGINAVLWNDATGEYDNLSLWGRRDERSSSGENALAVLCGVAPADRATRALAAVRARNWRPAGSVTIAPPMTHVDERNDHNFKVWPWWNAVEARARLRTGDIDGGIHLLERCAATLEDEHYPGLIEELVTPEGVSEGGHAFLSAAGSFLDGIFEGLLGIEVLEPGCVRLRVSPNVPASWTSWRAQVPLPEGDLFLTFADGRLLIRVTDPRVKLIEAPGAARVEGAQRATLSGPRLPEPAEWTAPEAVPVPALRQRNAATFFEEGIPAASLPGLPGRRVSAEDLARLDPADVGALVVAGNALPRRTRSGSDLQPALARFLDRGGALVFYGATMQDRGTMGETGGVIDWYEFRPVARFQTVTEWKLRPSNDGPGVARESERGMREGWFRPDLPDADWTDVKVPSWWEDHLGASYDGWGWYRAHVRLPAGAIGATVVVNAGKIDDDEWTYVNGVMIGSTRGAQRVRHYEIKPGDPAYAALNFGGDNVVAIQVLDGGGAGGMWAGVPGIGPMTGTLAWTPVSPVEGAAIDQPVRHGVVSWGPGGAFFNSWETSRGAFGFRIDGHGVEFSGPLGALGSLDIDVHEAFTDFAVSRPWIFQPLAFTETHRKLLFPDHGEHYPCAARVVNRETGGEIVLIPASVARTPAGSAVLESLRIRSESTR